MLRRRRGSLAAIGANAAENDLSTSLLRLFAAISAQHAQLPTTVRLSRNCFQVHRICRADIKIIRIRQHRPDAVVRVIPKVVDAFCCGRPEAANLRRAAQQVGARKPKSARKYGQSIDKQATPLKGPDLKSTMVSRHGPCVCVERVFQIPPDQTGGP